MYNCVLKKLKKSKIVEKLLKLDVINVKLSISV